jgi:hypothetical protein
MGTGESKIKVLSFAEGLLQVLSHGGGRTERQKGLFNTFIVVLISPMKVESS